MRPVRRVPGNYVRRVDEQLRLTPLHVSEDAVRHVDTRAGAPICGAATAGDTVRAVADRSNGGERMVCSPADSRAEERSEDRHERGAVKDERRDRRLRLTMGGAGGGWGGLMKMACRRGGAT